MAAPILSRTYQAQHTDPYTEPYTARTRSSPVPIRPNISFHLEARSSNPAPNPPDSDHHVLEREVLSDGMLGFMHARKIMDTPLPFPFAQICECLLLVMLMSVPFIVCATIEEAWLIYIFNSVTICGFVGLNEAARELENPFGYDPNDLELTILQA